MNAKYTFLPNHNQTPPQVPDLIAKVVNFGSSAFYNTGVNLILASVSIKPNAQQQYKLQVAASPSDTRTQFCRPRRVTTSPIIGVVQEPASISKGNSIELPLGNLFYDGKIIRNSFWLITSIYVNLLQFSIK